MRGSRTETEKPYVGERRVSTTQLVCMKPSLSDLYRYLYSFFVSGFNLGGVLYEQRYKIGLSDGNIQKCLSGLAAVGQSKKFIGYCDILFDLLSKGRAFCSELQLDDLPIRVDLWLAYPSLSLNKLDGLDH